MESSEEEKRGFLGWYIPIEIAEITGFHIYQMFLWAEIKSFSANGNKCFIKNETFAKRFGVNNNTITKSITALKAKNLVTQIGFDGRRRYLVANNPPSMNTTQKDKQTHTKRRGTNIVERLAASPQKESISIKDKVNIKNMSYAKGDTHPYLNIQKKIDFSSLTDEEKKERIEKMKEAFLNDKAIRNDNLFTRKKLEEWFKGLEIFGKEQYKTDLGNYYGGLKTFFKNYLKYKANPYTLHKKAI